MVALPNSDCQLRLKEEWREPAFPGQGEMKVVLNVKW